MLTLRMGRDGYGISELRVPRPNWAKPPDHVVMGCH